MRSLRCHSLHAAGGDARAVARALLAALDKAPSLLLWLADTTQPDHIAAELDAAAPVVVGGVSRAGLIGGGSEYERKAQVERAVALAVTLPVGATATAWYSSPTGLPELPAATWEMFATAPPDASPHLLMMGAPPHDAAFPIESFLASLDRVLPWANKVGGLLAGSSSLYVGAKRHDGGVAGVALQGVALDALVCQGATPVGPSFRISKARGVSVLELDGTAVGQHEALDALLCTESAVSGGTLMAGLSVPCGPTAAAGGAGGAAAAAAAARIAHAPEYVIRPILSYSREGGALQLGALCMATALALWAVQAQGGAAAFLRLGIGSEAPPESPSAWCLAIASTPRLRHPTAGHRVCPTFGRPGAAPALLEQPGARLQLHRHSAAAARSELRARASAYAAQHAAASAAGRPAAAGGLHVSCLGRGAAACHSAVLVAPQLGSLQPPPRAGTVLGLARSLRDAPPRHSAPRGCRSLQAATKLPTSMHVPHSQVPACTASSAPRAASWPRRSGRPPRAGWPAGSQAARSGPSDSAPLCTHIPRPSRSCGNFKQVSK